MKGTRLLQVLLLLGSYAVGQSTTGGAAEVEQLQVKREGADVKIEVILTGAVKPRVETATNPDRLVLVLPGTLSDAKQKRFPLNANGVQSVRVGLNSANPPVTRVVVDLDSARPYSLSLEGRNIVLRVQPPETARAARHDGPVPAASGPLVSVFRRQPQASTGDDGSTAQASIPVPPKLPPINFPEKQTASTQSTTTAATAAGSAAHPKLGSLQAGTVFPGMGSPGTGTVPVPQTSASARPTINAAAPSAPLVAVVTSGNGTSTLPGAPAATVAGNASASNSATVSATPATAPKSGGTQAVTLSSGSSSPAPVAIANGPAASPTTTPSAPTANATNATIATGTAGQPAAGQIPTAPASTASVGPTTSSAGAPNVTTKVLSATVTPPASAVTPAAPPASPTPSSSPNVAAASLTTALKPLPPQGAIVPSVGLVPLNTTAPGATASTASSPTPGQEGADDAATMANAIEPEMPALALRATHPDFRTSFRVKYVASGAAYLDGGRSAGLSEGMKLVVRDTATGSVVAAADGNDEHIIAELEVMSVAEASAVTDIHTPKRDVKPGDLAYLSSQDEQALVQQSTLSATRKYPTVISFTEGDTLDEEARAEIPKPPMPSVNRARGRLGFDYMGTSFRGSTGGSNMNLGVILRLDMTRIGGTYWNLSGYWRGRLNANSYSGTATLQDLINRTYHLSMIYDNPNSNWVAGFGRMYLPWATSLDTIDGGYFGKRLGHHATLGVFAGSTPDPTSWSYNPDRRIGGAFVNFEGGSFEDFRYTSTSGVGLSTLQWKIDRPFIFFENGIYYKRYVAIYDSLQADSPAGNQAVAAPGAGIGRNFLTVRFQPLARIEFDANYNYFRDLPTFDPALIGTGLLDKYLFQGFSGGVRLEVLKQVWVYTNLGRSSRSGDPTSSLNELYGLTLGRIPWVRVRADAHYSRFNSSFGNGYYESLSLSRRLSDNFRLEVLGGKQNFSSAYSSNSSSKFVTSNVEMNMGLHYFIQGGFTVSRGVVQNYDQWLFTLGYRFDTRQRAKVQ